MISMASLRETSRERILAKSPQANLVRKGGKPSDLVLSDVPGRHVPSNAILFQEGEAAGHVFQLVTGGVVKLYMLMSDGRRQVTGFVYPSRMFGVSSNSHYIATAETIGDCVIRVHSRTSLEQAIASDSELLSRMLESASEELSLAQEQMLMLGRRTARERVAWFLLRAAKDIASDGQSPPTIHLPMTEADIADYLGLSAETICRVLNSLKKEVMIAFTSPRHVTLLREDQLHELAGTKPDRPRKSSRMTAAKWPT